MAADLAATGVAAWHQDLTVEVVQHVSHHGDGVAVDLRVSILDALSHPIDPKRLNRPRGVFSTVSLR